ncbi:MAG: MraY family glycosyltransferase [Planctomycetota bacterium]
MLIDSLGENTDSVIVCTSAVFSALVFSLILVPIVRYLAISVGMTDKPDQKRKLQSKAISLGGGLAVYGSLAAAFCFTIWVDRTYFDQILGAIGFRWYVLFGCAAALMVVGLIDDRWGLRGRQKLLLQVLIVACLIGSNTTISQIDLIVYRLELGVFAYPVTMVWLLFAINALNLIDGADGMATTVGTIVSIGFGLVSLASMGPSYPAIVGFALAGSLMGFFVFNKPPASIYLGDAGSMMIGLFIGVLATWGTVKESTILAAAPIAIMILPLFDSTAAVVRRWLTGRSIYVTDRGHLHHLLQQRFGIHGMLAIVAIACIVTTSMAVLAVVTGHSWISYLGILLVGGGLIATKSFGHAEARLIMGRGFHFARSFTVHPSKCEVKQLHLGVPLQGDGPWETLWEPLVEFAAANGITQIKIDLNLAWIHEGYHAAWRNVRLPERASRLNVNLPLFLQRGDEEITIGRLEVVIKADDSRAYASIAALGDRLTDITPQLNHIVSELEAQKRFELTSNATVVPDSNPSMGAAEPQLVE